MLYQIISFLLEVATGLVGGACLLRFYMQQQRVGFSNPLGQFVFAVTDWLVLPLRRVLPALGRQDSASVVAAWAVELTQFVLLWGLTGGDSSFAAVLLLSAFGLVRLALSSLIGLLMIYAILSWVGQHSPFNQVVERLCAPPLAPVRRLVPLVGGIDLSPLILLVVLQVLMMLLGGLQAQLLLGMA